ncbi:MAG: hypothetical protein QOE90_1396 [Thermoplasmata archaeon]|jgi:hypothetical protein|nr:hypothetical protein [Thermoplasmata archaeon]
MEALLAAPRPVAPPAVLDLPPVLDTPLGQRLVERLARVPAFDWCHWGEVLAGVRLAEAAPALRFAQEGPTRVRLAGDDEAEVCVIGLLPGQTLAHAAHGQSEGILHLLAGQGRCEGNRLWGGDQLAIAPEQRRDVTNDGPGVLVAIALYAPRLGA